MLNGIQCLPNSYSLEVTQKKLFFSCKTNDNRLFIANVATICNNVNNTNVILYDMN